MLGEVMVKVLLFYPMHPVNINTEPPQDTQGMAQKELSDAVVWCVHRSRITRSIFVLFILVHKSCCILYSVLNTV